jgi:hypothetical protein
MLRIRRIPQILIWTSFTIAFRSSFGGPAILLLNALSFEDSPNHLAVPYVSVIFFLTSSNFNNILHLRSPECQHCQGNPNHQLGNIILPRTFGLCSPPGDHLHAVNCWKSLSPPQHRLLLETGCWASRHTHPSLDPTPRSSPDAPSQRRLVCEYAKNIYCMHFLKIRITGDPGQGGQLGAGASRA